MGDSNAQPPETPSLFSAGCNAARMFPFIIAPEEAMGIVDMCKHDRQLYIRCRDCEIDAFLAETDGLELHTVNNLGRVDLSLPHFIPIADDFAFREELDIGTEFIGLQLKDTFRKGDRSIATDIIRNSPLLRGRQVIQFSSGRDDLLEPMWAIREEMEWFRNMRTMGLAAATGVNFSVYECMCPFGQHFNIKKSLFSASLMQAAGVPAIPHFYAVNPNQRAREIRWLNANPEVRLISINCQSQKTYQDLRVLKETIIYFLENSNKELHIILEGFRLNRLEGLYPYLPYLHIAQKQPFMDGLNYSVVDFNTATGHFVYGKTRIPKELRGALVVRSIEARRQYLARLYAEHAHELKVPAAWHRVSTLSAASVLHIR